MGRPQRPTLPPPDRRDGGRAERPGPSLCLVVVHGDRKSRDDARCATTSRRCRGVHLGRDMRLDRPRRRHPQHRAVGELACDAEQPWAERRDAAPASYPRERVDDAITDVAHRALFGRRDRINVHARAWPAAPRSPSTGRCGPHTSRVARHPRAQARRATRSSHPAERCSCTGATTARLFTTRPSARRFVVQYVEFLCRAFAGPVRRGLARTVSREITLACGGENTPDGAF